MDEDTSFNKNKRQTINPLMDEINKETEPLLKSAMIEFGEPLSLAFRLYNQIRFYEEYGKLHLGVSVASKDTLAKQFGVTIKQIEGAFNNLTNIKKLGRWVHHDEPVFRNITRTWMSNVRFNRGKNNSNEIRVILENSNGIRAKLLSDKSKTLMGLELVTDTPPLSESKKKVSESKCLTKVKGETPVKFGNPDINELFEYWQEIIGYEITSRRQANRNACKNLVARHTLIGTKKLVEGVRQAQDDKYAPRIADFCDLQSKLNQLLVWGKSKQTIQEVF